MHIYIISLFAFSLCRRFGTFAAFMTEVAQTRKLRKNKANPASSPLGLAGVAVRARPHAGSLGMGCSSPLDVAGAIEIGHSSLTLTPQLSRNVRSRRL